MMISNERPADWVARYLARLRLTPEQVAEPSLATLRLIQRAHLSELAYDNLSIMFGRPDSVAEVDCLTRVGSGGRLGYCFGHNTAAHALLTELGYAVSRRSGYVWTWPHDRDHPSFNHLLLVVSGLATLDNPAGHWWFDVGLGEGFGEPLPLRSGEHAVDGFSYTIRGADEAAPTGPSAWSYAHPTTGTFRGVEVTSGPCGAAAVGAAHQRLSTDSPFTEKIVVQRVVGGTSHTVRGLVYAQQSAAGTTRTYLSDYDQWREVLTGTLNLSLSDSEEPELRALFADTEVAHLAWVSVSSG